MFGLGCAPQAPDPEGASVEEVFGKGGRTCGRGVAVLSTDYMSTHVSLLGLDGSTLSGTFLTSGSADTNLNAALSGDVVFPSARMKEEIVLIDRLAAGVLTFVELETAEVRAQLSVQTGFNANPQDYFRLDEERALVTRLETNPTPGQEPFDIGDDALVLDPEQPAITERLEFSAAVSEGARARPGRMLSVGSWLLVHLSGHSADFQEAEDARLAVLDQDTLTIHETITIPGMKNCAGLALSPEQSRLAVSCSGLVKHSDGPAPQASGVVLFEITDSAESLTLREEGRLEASELLFGPFAPTVSFVDENRILAATYGALEGSDAGRPDRILLMDLKSGTEGVLLQTEEIPFSLESLLCAEACGVCFVADAERNVVHRLEFEEGALSRKTEHAVETGVALPVRLLGWF